MTPQLAAAQRGIVAGVADKADNRRVRASFAPPNS